MTIQDQYTSTLRQTQETWAGAVESFTKDLQKTFGQPASSLGFVDPREAIDQVFDFWEKSLEVQRDFAKQLASVSVAASEQIRTQAESFGSAVREQVESFGSAVREQTESVGSAVREQAESAEREARAQARAAQREAREQSVKKYQDLTKPELQDELASRDLPKTGNVDELRERLIADDTK